MHSPGGEKSQFAEEMFAGTNHYRVVQNIVSARNFRDWPFIKFESNV